LGNLEYTAYLIWFAAIFDFLDGLIARWFNVRTPLGKDLDSLADLVSFGVCPSLIIYYLLNNISDSAILPYVAFFITVYSAIRLAKFNIDPRQAVVFYGLPTPANGILVSSFPFIFQSATFHFLNNIYTLIGITILLSYLLVSNIEMFSFKFETYSWAENKIKYVFIATAGTLFIVFNVFSIPLIIFFYVMLSISRKHLLN